MRNGRAKNDFFVEFFVVKHQWFRKLILILRIVCGRRACKGRGSLGQTKKQGLRGAFAVCYVLAKAGKRKKKNNAAR